MTGTYFLNKRFFSRIMGNSTGAVDDGLKAQAGGANGPVTEFYKLLSVDGSGELLRLQKIANHTKDYTLLDDMIRNEVKKFLYNDGQCEDVSIFMYFVGKRKDTRKKL